LAHNQKQENLTTITIFKFSCALENGSGSSDLTQTHKLKLDYHVDSQITETSCKRTPKLRGFAEAENTSINSITYMLHASYKKHLMIMPFLVKIIHSLNITGNKSPIKK